MNEGDVILAPIQQADGLLKNRPAIILREIPPFRDALVCGVSTQIQQFAPQLDELITESDHDFRESGLLRNSVIRLGFLAVLPRNKILGSIGSISSDRHRRLLQRLSDFLIKRN